MEPQTNFRGITDQSQPVYKTASKKSGCGKFAIIGTIVLLLVIAGIAYGIYYAVTKGKDVLTQKLNENIPDIQKTFTGKDLKPSDDRFKGDMMDAIILPNSDGPVKLWILTDASSKYILKQKSTGHYSMGVACNECKTMSYLFDPIKGEVSKSDTKTFQTIISESHMLIINGNPVQFTRGNDKEPPSVVTYNPNTMEVISDTKVFIEKHPELAPGINQLNVRKDDNYVEFEMKDGQHDKIYSPQTDKVYDSESSWLDDLGSNAGDEIMSLCMTQSDTKDKRENVYKVSAPASLFVKRGLTIHSHFMNAQLPSIGDKTIKAEKLLDKSYLMGCVFYSDEDYAMVVYADQVGKNSTMLVACIDVKKGTEAWTISPDQLFAPMKNNQKFDKYDVERYVTFRRNKGLMTMQFKGYGIMGLDMETGKKLWEYFIYNT